MKRKLTEEEKFRQAQILARKISLLLDSIFDDAGRPYDYPAIEAAAAQKAGYFISRTRWSRLKNGQFQVVPDECLRALAAVFGVDPEYLMREDAKLPAQLEVTLPQVRIKRLYEVRDFATKALRRLDPEGFGAIAKILDQALQKKNEQDEGPSYATPKLDGHRVALRGRVLPQQHARASAQAARHGLSLSEYLAALIDRDSGLPTRLDNEAEALIPRAS